MVSQSAFCRIYRLIPCKCWTEDCHNFISPYLQVRPGAVFCSPACREIGSRLAWLFQACPTCGGKFKKSVGHRLCEACQNKLDADRQRRRAVRLQRNLLAPLPEKNCAWRYCQAPFVPAVGWQKYCGRQCMLNSNAGGGIRGEIPSPVPTSSRDVLCAGGCGGWVSFYPFAGGNRCYQCFLGLKYGKLNHLPPLPTPEVGRPGKPVPATPITKGFLPWVVVLTVGLGVLAVGWHRRSRTKLVLTSY